MKQNCKFILSVLEKFIDMKVQLLLVCTLMGVLPISCTLHAFNLTRGPYGTLDAFYGTLDPVSGMFGQIARYPNLGTTSCTAVMSPKGQITLYLNIQEWSNIANVRSFKNLIST